MSKSRYIVFINKQQKKKKKKLTFSLTNCFLSLSLFQAHKNKMITANDTIELTRKCLSLQTKY